MEWSVFGGLVVVMMRIGRGSGCVVGVSYSVGGDDYGSRLGGGSGGGSDVASTKRLINRARMFVL
jgi:hypothetical protein